MSEERLTRTFATELDEGEGRTLFGRLIPYGQTQRVADLRPDGSWGMPYQERIARGAFERDTRLWKAPNRVELRYEHGQGLMDTVGHGVTFEDKADGFYGTFRALDSPAGEQGLALARAGILQFFSVEMVPKRKRVEGDLVTRIAVRVAETSLVRDPAYKGTEVAVRMAAVTFERPIRDAALDSRLSVLGFGQN